jgi:hypothetical protein
MTPKLLNSFLLISTVILYFYVVEPLYSGVESLFWSPGENNVQTLSKLNLTYDATIASVDTVVADAKKAKKEYENFDEETKRKIMIMVPTEINSLKLLSELSNLATDKGFAIDNLGVKDKGNGEYSVDFSVLATYSKFKEEIVYFERSMRILNLQGLSFSPGKTQEDPTKFTVSFSTYYMK